MESTACRNDRAPRRDVILLVRTGTSRALREARLESEMRTKAKVRQYPMDL